MKKKYPIQVLLREYFEGVLAALFLALFLRFFIISVLFIPSSNMEPTLKKGDFVLGLRISYGFPLPLMKGERLNVKIPKVGDVVSFRFPGDEEQTLIRRVVGVPGDRIEIKEGQLFRNNRPVQSPALVGEYHRETLEGTSKSRSYPILATPSGSLRAMRVKKDTVFVLSDDRTSSDDSRDWGLVPLKNIESRVVLIWLSITNDESGLSLNRNRIFSRVY